MGGLVFANITTATGEPVKTPRLAPDLYRRISAEYQVRLETIFDKVAVPRDAPGKLDYGDVDFLVKGIRSGTPSANIWGTIEDLLNAKVHLARGGSHSYGVQHPEILDAFVQIDVELSPGDDTPDGAELFEWTRFMKGDSDLLQIIGVSHRPLGLTCNDRGLHVRVEEIEPYNRQQALLFLTRDPDTMMRFYGLDTKKYWTGFADETELFDWATSGRFFAPEIFDARLEKSNDRSRQAKRPMYRRFVEVYMSTHHSRSKARPWTRQEVLSEALSMFSGHAKYHAMMAKHHEKEVEKALWMRIRDELPVEGHSLVLALKALRRWVVFEDGRPHIAEVARLEDPVVWTQCMLEDGEGNVLAWVKENWEEAKRREKVRANAAKAMAKSI